MQRREGRGEGREGRGRRGRRRRKKERKEGKGRVRGVHQTSGLAPPAKNPAGALVDGWKLNSRRKRKNGKIPTYY
jgi:hypothetical protein